MKEYRMTDGTNIIIEIARTEQDARESGAKRLECAAKDMQIIEVRRRPMTPREARQESYWEKYAEYLMRMGRTPRPAALMASSPKERVKKSAPPAATERDAEQITLHTL